MTVFNDAYDGTRAVRATAQGEVFTGTIGFGCRKDMTGGGVKFWNYFGSALPRAPEDHPQTTEHPVWFYFDNTRFQVTLIYTPWEGVWTASGGLDSRVLEHWASGSRLEIVNMSGDTVTTFGLNQSRAAREKMRQVCGF